MVIQDWDCQVDVAVAGYGLAGAVAAIAAHDAGSRVLLLEKAPHPGGLSILSGGGVKGVKDVEAATGYFTRLSGGRLPRNFIRSFAEGLAQNERFLRKLAETDGAKITTVEEWAGESLGVYPFPGRDCFVWIRVAQVPGFERHPWVYGAHAGGSLLLRMIIDNVEKRGIEVWLKAPAKRLITDSAGNVLGLVAERSEREIRVKARQGVILATGGFEQNEWLRLHHLEGVPFYSMAPLTHTGDGILMAQKVGAALWHMWHVHGSYGFKFPEFPIAFRHAGRGRRSPKARTPWIVVDKFGRRYMNESPPAAQDTPHRAMQFFDADLPEYPRIPSYLIFDEEGRKRGPIARCVSMEEEVYAWSRDNSAEIERGWIKRADDLRQLAHKIREIPENEGKMDPQTLEASVAQWNAIVRNGQDPLGRPPGTMVSIDAAPFYAVQVWPVISNTQGGPMHNAKRQVLDSFQRPISRLYTAGELGSFFGHLYEQAGNLGECVASGRIAGEEAAKNEPWTD